ncbi:MAG: hypothetical protein J07HN4v3_01718 [Halonotius sp. J07HN4]|nr:MAG: hypothetical protein J07HN4v3_01718 [Halonotius sp. J07HN4]
MSAVIQALTEANRTTDLAILVSDQKIGSNIGQYTTGEDSGLSLFADIICVQNLLAIINFATAIAFL